MRRLLTGLTLLCVIALLLPALAAAQDDAQPNILIEEMRHDMGEVFEQDFYKYTFKIKNTGTADLEIKSVKPG